MNKYMCAYYSSVNGKKIKYEIFADDPEEAVGQLIETFPNTEHRAIRITGQGMKKMVFQNTNYAQSGPDADEVKQLHTEQLTRSSATQSTSPSEEDTIFIPFKPAVFSGKDSLTKVTRELRRRVSEFENKGYKFVRIDTIHVDVKPGCLGAIFGKTVQYYPYEFIVFRKARPKM